MIVAFGIVIQLMSPYAILAGWLVSWLFAYRFVTGMYLRF
jgi:hypothetical protein